MTVQINISHADSGFDSGYEASYDSDSGVPTYSPAFLPRVDSQSSISVPPELETISQKRSNSASFIDARSDSSSSQANYHREKSPKVMRA